MTQTKNGWHILRKLETRDNTLPLRRFMNLYKFQHLINTQTLYLSPASTFNDKFEGHYTSKDHKDWDNQLVDSGFDLKARKMAAEAKSIVANHNQAAVVISCWTTAPAHDAQMWEEYAGSTEAVVIETTVERLRNTLGFDFLIIPIQYLDFEKDTIPKEHSLSPFCYKQRKDYQWEREVRVIGKRIGSPRNAPIILDETVKSFV